MKKLILALSIVAFTVGMGGCSMRSTTYPSGTTYTTYNVGYSYYNPGYRYVGSRFYDSDFYVGDRVYYGPRYYRGYWRGW